MNIIMIGCGKVGLTLVKQLLAENHTVSVIDNDENVVKEVNNTLDVICYCGNGASFEVQKEAGVETADLVIAVTHSDELNLLCCLIAKKAGDCMTIARVRNPIYSSEITFLKESLGLAMTINPDQAAAKEISRVLRRKNVLDIDSFAKGRVELTKIEILKGSPLCDLPIYQLNDKFHCELLIAMVERGDEVIIPQGNCVLKEGDFISFVATPQNAVLFLRKIGLRSGSAKNCMIIGGSKSAYYLAEQLLSHGSGVKIIEKSLTRAEELSEMLPKAEIIHGDGTDEQLLLEEGIANMDAFVSLTDVDEENILLGLFARSNSSARVITKVNRIGFDKVIDSLDIGTVVNPKSTTSESILQYVRALQNATGSNVETLYQLIDGKVEALEFIIREESGITRSTLLELGTRGQLLDNTLICSIIRDGRTIIPRGSDRIQVGDTVIVVTAQKGLTDIKDLLKR